MSRSVPSGDSTPPWHGAAIDDAQAQRYLVQVDRHIAESKVHIALQRTMLQHIKHASQSTELAHSMLETLEGNLHALERHRKFILSKLKRDSAVQS